MGKRKRSQSKRILQVLEMGGRLSPLQALDLCGCMRLAARIKDLRDDGHLITTAYARSGSSRFAVYSLTEGGEE